MDCFEEHCDFDYNDTQDAVFTKLILRQPRSPSLARHQFTESLRCQGMCGRSKDLVYIDRPLLGLRPVSLWAESFPSGRDSIPTLAPCSADNALLAMRMAPALRESTSVLLSNHMALGGTGATF